MRNRDYKTFAANNYYHVFNRSVGKIDIFKSEFNMKGDFEDRLKEHKKI